MQFLWKYIDDLVGKGLEVSVLSELLFYASATFVPMALPLAILLSSLMTFGNLGEYYELVALKSAGISLQRVMLPLINASILISIFAFVFANNIMPVANLKFRTLLHDIRRQRPELNIKPGIFYKGIDNFVIKAGNKNNKTGMMYDVLIYDHTDKRGNTNVTIADSAYMKITEDKSYMLLTLFNGEKYEELPEDRKPHREFTYPHQHSLFNKEIVMLDLSGFGLRRTDENLFKENYEMLNISQLQKQIDSLHTEIDKWYSNFNNNLLRSNFFKREIKIDNLKIKPDTTVNYDVDSVFDSYNISQQRKIIQSALNYARATQTYINTS